MITAEQLVRDGLGTYGEPKQLERGFYAGHWAHLAQMMFTVGVMVTHAKDNVPVTRWCYATHREAREALAAWDGEGDPPGEWIKQKGWLAGGGHGNRRRVPDRFDRES